tara:strand:+ start:5052 stop:5459 length:408 start_codon:yes stop_codon:yes gene_type:complete
MSAEAAVYARLSGYSGLTDLVGDRIYPMVIPPEKRGDAVTYQLIGTTPTPAMRADAPLTRSRIQVSCYGTKTSSQSAYASAKAVRDQVVAALNRFRGTVGGVAVQAVYRLTEFDLYDDDAKVDGVAVDFDVVFEE